MDVQWTCEMFYKDTAGHMDVTAVAGTDATNTNLVKRRSFFGASKQVDLISHLHFDMAFQECLILSDVGL